MNDVFDDTHRPRSTTITLTLARRAPIVASMLLALTLACDIVAPSHEAPRAGAEAEAPLGENEASAGAGHDDPDGEPDWCAARRVLEAKCQRCHAAPPDHGAPFPLVRYDDTQTINASGEARFVALAAAVSNDFMPPTFITLEPPVLPLEPAEKALLLRWCRAGAPPAPPATDTSEAPCSPER